MTTPFDTPKYSILDSHLPPFPRIESVDEGQGVTYSLQVKIDGNTYDIDNTTAFPGYLGGQINLPGAPNLQGGGWILIDPVSGEITWKTTNADVTVDTGQNYLTDGKAYEFIVTADDHTTGTLNSTVTESFFVKVLNERTTINDIPNQQFEQGQLWQLTDGEVRAGDTRIGDERVGPGTWYSLTVLRDGTPGTAQDVADFNTEVVTTGGAPITFDPLTGAMSWSSTTNRDVGLYHFEVTHHDGHNTIAVDPFDVSLVNKMPEWTSTPPDGQVVMATKPFVYDANTTEEGLHDWWTGHDVAEYSIVEGPSDMTIDSGTGLVSWTADPRLAGDVTITLKMEDGNGGVIFQTFTITVDDPHNNLPENARDLRSPFVFDTRSEEPPNPEAGAPVLGAIPEGIWGSWERPTLPTAESHPVPGNELLEAILSGQFKSFEELSKALDEYGLQQPSLDKPGSTSPITELAGYPEDVAHGKRLDFNAGEIWQWQDLTQPSLDIPGSESPDTPLEGYIEATESGKRLNFGYHPIRDAQSLTLGEMRVADLLGL